LPTALLRPAPLLAASLPALDETPEEAGGRLLPRAAASERDYRDQAGLLVDAEPDLVLVEGQATTVEVRLATGIALETGLPTWVALSGFRSGDVATTRAVDALAGMAVSCLLLPGDPPSGSELPGEPQPPPALPVDWGGLLRSPVGADEWLDAGAMALGLLDMATPDRIAQMRAAIDRRVRAALEVAQGADDGWWTHVRRAASMAGGGPALWLLDPSHEAPSTDRLPAGFARIVAGADEMGALPDDHFDLIIDQSGSQAERRSAGWLRRGLSWLRHGGILVTRGLPDPGGAGLRIVAVDDAYDPVLVISRREE